MVADLIPPIKKQIQLLEIEFGNLTVEKTVEKTGQNAAYFLYIKLACKALSYGVELMKKAEQQRQKALQ